jgi:hypothetical protein
MSAVDPSARPSPIPNLLLATHISGMPERRMTYRLVPLRSAAAGDSRLGESPAERLAMLAELSRAAWRASGRMLPSYTREAMPVHLTTLEKLGRPVEP